MSFSIAGGIHIIAESAPRKGFHHAPNGHYRSGERGALHKRFTGQHKPRQQQRGTRKRHRVFLNQYLFAAPQREFTVPVIEAHGVVEVAGGEVALRVAHGVAEKRGGAPGSAGGLAPASSRGVPGGTRGYAGAVGHCQLGVDAGRTDFCGSSTSGAWRLTRIALLPRANRPLLRAYIQTSVPVHELPVDARTAEGGRATADSAGTVAGDAGVVAQVTPLSASCTGGRGARAALAGHIAGLTLRADEIPSFRTRNTGGWRARAVLTR